MGEPSLIEVTDWWCPTEGRWSMCPGPCPDGTPHDISRTKQVMTTPWKCEPGCVFSFAHPGRACTTIG